MKKLSAAIGAATILFSTAAIAQDDGKRSSKGAIVIELEAPKADDVAKGIVAGDLTYYQKGGKRTSSQRGLDAEKFCNRIRYKFGSVLAYQTVQTGESEFDYLKRVVCYD
jgi:hypothetical protein